MELPDPSPTISTSPTTPTTCSTTSWPKSSAISRPRGSCSGNSTRARESLMTMAAVPSTRSRPSKSRPANKGIPMTSKKFSSTMRHWALSIPPGSGRAPAGYTAVSLYDPLMGRMLVEETASMPGTASSRAMIAW